MVYVMALFRWILGSAVQVGDQLRVQLDDAPASALDGDGPPQAVLFQEGGHLPLGQRGQFAAVAELGRQLGPERDPQPAVLAWISNAPDRPAAHVFPSALAL